MPTRAPKICRCGRKVAYGTQCVCAAQRKAMHDRRRPSPSRRGYDQGWRDAAKSFLGEPGHDRCDCGATATLVRHVISIRRRPDLRLVKSNWRPGCVRCNAIDAARDRKAQP